MDLERLLEIGNWVESDWGLERGEMGEGDGELAIGFGWMRIRPERERGVMEGIEREKSGDRVKWGLLGFSVDLVGFPWWN